MSTDLNMAAKAEEHDEAMGLIEASNNIDPSDDQNFYSYHGDNIQSLLSSIQETYKPKWISSEIDDVQGSFVVKDDIELYDGVVETNGENDFDFDSLPYFADDECKKLSMQIKMMIRQRDEAARQTKEHIDRTSAMKDHQDSVRQEIIYTNGLIAAKQKEIETEKHLIALADRERVGIFSELSKANDFIQNGKDRVAKLKTQISQTRKEMEALKLSSDWNQEELERWAAVATKRENDKMTLEKCKRADESKVKELSLKLENATQLSVEKRTELENQKIESQSKQLEIHRMSDQFKLEHEERMKLVNQWQSTVLAMKERDIEINRFAMKFKAATETKDKQMRMIADRREDILNLKTQIDEMQQILEALDRAAQEKRKEKIDEGAILRSLHDELDSVKLESSGASISLQNAKTAVSILVGEVAEKEKHLKLFHNRVKEIKSQLLHEKNAIQDKEGVSLYVNERFKRTEKEVKLAGARIDKLREHVFKESNNLATLREKESNLLSEIQSTKNIIKNLSSRLKQLQRDRDKQQEVVNNVESKMRHIESKVARGLGERSTEEKEQLMKRISQLEEDRKESKEKNTKVEQQSKIVNQELKRILKKNDSCEINRNDIRSAIDAIELEITSCELSLEKLRRNKEENMVTQDVVRLEVRRLRDILNLKVTEVFDHEQKNKELWDKMNGTRHSLNAEIESKRSKLRAVEDERHQCAVESGQRAIAAEKMKSKYEMIMKARNGSDHDSERGNTSQVYHLVAAAQRRADLQREGDELDAVIRKKHQDIMSMQTTLAHLKKRNTDFRHSFQKVDKESDEYRQMLILQNEVEASERQILELKKTIQDCERSLEASMTRLNDIHTNHAQMSNENADINERLSALEVEIKEKEEEGTALNAELQHER
mmetsp:Transcript_2653/g.4939  ORF Transcript_2653/g.4939 Transcript_2653/m.4939 type:complete len:891 (+) Transcript_2653:26-2698(+)